MLKVDGISTYYGKIRALQDVSLEVRRGEIIAIIGANGAGKTTLLCTIAGLLKPQSGKIICEDRDITLASPDKIVAAGMALVAEGRRLFSSMTVKENLELGAYTRWRRRSEVARSKEMVLRLFPILEDRLEQSAGTLSGGEQQMLAVGRALMCGPKIMLLDEPSMGLAPLVIRDIFKALQKLNDEGMTILLVEQDAKLALSFADRGYVLQTGSVLLQDTGSKLMTNPEVQDIYFGKRRKKE